VSSYSETCLDSNVLVRSVDDEPHPEIKKLWREWLRDRVMLHAPALLRYEVVNALYQQQRAGKLGAAEVSHALATALSRPIILHNDDELHLRALQLAANYALPVTYDAHYLALAERMGVELWTTDAKLVRAVEDQLAWVRLVS
jgi:predicted nucleic acid-binding protein